MLVMITGGSGSGKSKYAEEVAVDYHKAFGGSLYYVATMQSFDDEMDKKITRHREMRMGKGFKTIECPLRLENLSFSPDDVVLLECISNLLSNEMYAEEGRIKERENKKVFLGQVQECIVKAIFCLEQQAGCVVVVTNEVFSAGMNYDRETLTYIEGLGYINQRLSQEATAVTEVVCGIPVWIKERSREYVSINRHGVFHVFQNTHAQDNMEERT